ncbi:MAG: tRNA (N6-isopentenyl adenosine(37)-C2)-methylthiotransferase MiaB [bacterium]|nr:tRNA (N6-isopentenyl adenosine(37)-C2)-methylthiotransferase MiaB [bacterium]
MKKTVHILTFGCQMNEHDSELIAGLLQSVGYAKTATPEDADMVLLNTCSIREKAEHKLFSRLGKLRALKQKRPGLILGICGCVAQQEAEHIFKRAPYVDLVLGTKAIPKLPMLLQTLEYRPRVLDVSETDWNDESQYFTRECRFKAFITIIRGCDNFCSYCVVPYTRGREESRTQEDILTEARRLIDDGAVELTLLGQNVSSYRHAGEGFSSFPNLLRALNELAGLERIRFITAHPKDLTDELIRVMAELPKVCEHFHLPVQSGSNRILGLMNRRYTREWYLDRIRLLREAIPGIAISTDIIAGFPGETEEDFQQTLAIQRELRYDGIFAFKYSARPNARAGSLEDQLPEALKSERLQQIFDLQRDINLENNQRLIGKRVEVLPEMINPRFPDTLTGRTRSNHVVTFKGAAELLGKLAQVDISDAHHFRLSGELVE